VPAEFSGDPYALLRVARTASPPEIKDAYRRLAKATHPDVDARPEAMVQMVRLNQAYELLADPARRKRWDALNPLPKPGKADPPTKRPTTTQSTTRPWAPAQKAGPTKGTTTARPPGPTSATGRPAVPSRPPSTANPYPDPPTLEEALAFRVGFGSYHGRTLREVAADDPGYLDWIIRSVTDRPRLVACSKLVRKHLPELERSARADRTAPAAGAKGRTIPVPPTAPEGPTAMDRLRDLLARERFVMIAVAVIAALVTFLLAVVLILVMSAG